jgi:endonuclease V-like protein UPF0215 family
MKANPIVIGFDDASFEIKSKIKSTYLIGVVCQGVRVVQIVKGEISIDGMDATKKLIQLVKMNEKHIQYILTHTITFGGFNIIDFQEIYDGTQIPIIAITDQIPDIDAVQSALRKNFPDEYKEKIQYILNAGELFQAEIKTAGGLSKIYYHSIGIKSHQDVKQLLEKICIDSKIPECLRLAHLIGRLF